MTQTSSRRTVRVLHTADTHLGFDLPDKPRVHRRRRGAEFFDNFRRALDPARMRQVDLVVHGGDVFFRSKVSGRLVHRVMEPILEVADAGVPFFIVPGNHERSGMPMRLAWNHPNVRIFDKPKTYELEVRGARVALAGFPFVRNDIRGQFSNRLHRAGYRDRPADIRFLCLHQTVEGATVGPVNYTFRSGHDIVPGSALPRGFAAVLAGHIHRVQVITADLTGRKLAAPVLYPGSIDRTSFAERNEQKGFFILEAAPSNDHGGRLVKRQFIELPTRPMVDLELDVRGCSAETVRHRIRQALDTLDPDSIVRLTVRGTPGPGARSALAAGSLRRLAPGSLNVELRFPRK